MWKSMSSKQEWRTVLLWVHDHNSACAAHLFIKSGLWLPSPLRFLAPRFSQCDLFQTWLSSSHLTVGTFNGFPELLLVCLRLHLMLWGSFATPVHFYPQDTVFHTSGLCPVFASSVCPLPGMFSRSSLIGYLLLQGTYGFLQENFLTTQTHLETSLVYSLLVPCSLVEHIHILTNYFSDNLFKACLHPLPITLKEEEVYLSCSSTQPKNLA